MDVQLNNGLMMPSPGFGTGAILGWQRDNDEVAEILAEAIRIGYRHLDTASIYGNEHSVGRAIKAGRVWTNCYHAYPAHAAFGGYKESGIGRETHKMMLDHYQQTKNLLVSYSEQKLGFF